VESLVLIEGRPCGGETDTDLVTGAWDFTAINTRYERHLAVLRERPDGPGGARLHAWIKREQAAWKQAVSPDPLLPQALLPAGYLGPKAWDARAAAFAQLAQSMPSVH
jgi:DNA-binding transcriptional regulator PaaX